MPDWASNTQIGTSGHNKVHSADHGIASEPATKIFDLVCISTKAKNPSWFTSKVFARVEIGTLPLGLQLLDLSRSRF